MLTSSNWVQATKDTWSKSSQTFFFFFVIFAPVQTAEPEQQGALASHTVLFGEELQQAAHLSVVQAQAGGASSLLPGHSGLTVGAGGGGSETMEAEGQYRVQRERGRLSSWRQRDTPEQLDEGAGDGVWLLSMKDSKNFHPQFEIRLEDVPDVWWFQSDH